MNHAQSDGQILGVPVRPAAAIAAPTGVVSQELVTLDRQRANWVALWRLIALGSLGGLAGGFVAGLWLRLAMRMSGILTEERNRRVLTEADARVGDFTLEGTLFLVFSASSAGIFGGVLYVAIRQWLPPGGTGRALSFGALLLATLGFFLIVEHNPDFDLFGPNWLNVAMYSVTYIVYGMVASLIVERLDTRVVVQARVRLASTRSRLAMVALSPFAVLGLALTLALTISGLGIDMIRIMFPMAIVGIVIALANRSTTWRWARHPAVNWFGAIANVVPVLTGMFLTAQGFYGILAG
jgi:hypothetical protein